MVVTHDRYFLDNVTGWILEIERGRGYPFEGNYSSWLDQKRKRLAQEEKEESARQRALAAEQEWIAASPRARQAKNRARIQRYEEMLATLAGPRRRRSRNRHPPRSSAWQRGDRGGGPAQGLWQQPADRRPEFRLPPGGIVGVIGPNGAGKTTLFRMIIGQEKPDAGTLRVGETVKLGYVDQSRDSLERRQDRVAGDQRRRETRSIWASAACRRAPMSARSTSRGPTSRRRSASCRAASATGCIWRRC